jgi:hypothetical protein
MIFKPGQESLAVNVIKNIGNPIADMIANKSRYFPFQKFLLYISKVEPSQFVNYKHENTIKQFLELRIISALEAAALICGHHFVQSNLQVKYISTSINGDNFKYLKTKKETSNMSETNDNIFKESTYDYYMNRPNELENETYIDYFNSYEIILKHSKRKLPLKAKKFNDKTGIFLYNFKLKLRLYFKIKVTILFKEIRK